MGDDDDGLAAVAHIPQHGKELLGLLGGQHGGRLVQDQNIRAPVEHLDDLHRLLLGDGHIVNLLVRVHVKAVGVADFPNFLSGLRQIQPPGQTQNDVLRRGEHIHQLEMLMDHADAVGEGILGGADDHRLSVDGDLPLVGEIDAGEHIHQGGLAAAVFTQQGQNFSPVDVQPDLVVGQDGPEGFGDVPHFHRWNFPLVRVGGHRLFNVQGRHAPFIIINVEIGIWLECPNWNLQGSLNGKCDDVCVGNAFMRSVTLDYHRGSLNGIVFIQIATFFHSTVCVKKRYRAECINAFPTNTDQQIPIIRLL